MLSLGREVLRELTWQGESTSLLLMLESILIMSHLDVVDIPWEIKQKKVEGTLQFKKKKKKSTVNVI